MSELEFHIVLELWNCILSEFHKVSKSLQDPDISLATCATLYSSLSAFIDSLKKDFGNIENETKNHVPNVDYRSTSKRARKRKRHFDELSDPAEPEEQLSPQDTFQLKSSIPSWKQWNQIFQKEQRCTHLLPKLFHSLLI